MNQSVGPLVGSKFLKISFMALGGSCLVTSFFNATLFCTADGLFLSDAASRVKGAGTGSDGRIAIDTLTNTFRKFPNKFSDVVSEAVTMMKFNEV